MIKRDQRGFTLIELLLAIAIAALIASAATMAMFQVINVTKSSNDRLTVIRQVQNAGYYISQDAQMAEFVIIDDDWGTWDLLLLTWTEEEEPYGENEPWHEVRYYLGDVSGDIGKLRRSHLFSCPPYYENTVVAEYVYCKGSDPDNTTRFSYQNSMLTAQITACLGEAEETKEYRVYRRLNF